MQYAFADFVARHAIAVLSVITVVTLALSAVAWRVLTTVVPRMWPLAIDLWNRARASRFAHWLRTLPLAGRFLSSTLTIARYLGIVAILGLGFSAGALVLFVELADEIGAGESLAEFDVALSAALREHLSLATLRAFSIITHLGDVRVLFAIGLVVFAVLAARRLKLLAAAWVVTTLSGGLLNRILKSIFERTRPLHDHGLTVAEGWSFPSGHASGSMLIYGLLAYVVVRSSPPAWHIPVALVGAALIIFVGTSRVLLQVHYLSDVLAGYAWAAAWIAICIATLETVRWREQQRSHLSG
ncbi:MAG TPA: phosphatase PAP2 family protein [Steroidobacteraceae bacterium]|nr:phosphatase PAP2 family protein [Steroidobacteraceae bacterium]